MSEKQEIEQCNAAFNYGRPLLIVAEERTLKSFQDHPPKWEVVGWFASFYEADRWVKQANKKRSLLQRQYRNVERSDQKWPTAREKGQIRVT